MKYNSYMVTLFREYKKSLKDISVEATLDLYLFRPIGFVIVKLIYRFPVTPNQLSFSAIVTGIISGVLFAKGGAAGFLYAGIFYGVTNILDCCDGMIARLKKTGTYTGRIIDGFVDYVKTVAMYIGLGIGLSKAGFEFPLSPWLLVALSAVSTALQSILFDYYRNEFMSHALGKVNSTQDEIKKFSAQLEKLKQTKGKYFDRLLIRLYLLYSGVQVTKTSTEIEYDPEIYYNANRLLLKLWSWIGTPSHVLVLMVSSFLYKPEIFFCYTLGVANVWMISVWAFQIRTNRKLSRYKSEK